MKRKVKRAKKTKRIESVPHLLGGLHPANRTRSVGSNRGLDLNQRPLGYECTSPPCTVLTSAQLPVPVPQQRSTSCASRVTSRRQPKNSLHLWSRSAMRSLAHLRAASASARVGSWMKA